MKRKLPIVFLLLLMLLTVVTGCSTKSKTQNKSTTNLTTKPTEDTQFLMGTVCTIKIYNKNKSAALDDGFARIKKLADEITVNQKGSEVDKINAEAGKKPVKVSADVYDLCKKAYYYSQ
ncbi:MAG: FAD:protein FMN transferase, partial [Lactobacillus amylovorus]|nr:FAD:protein FMN transferase [Lactobacillus amylovorus]